VDRAPVSRSGMIRPVVNRLREKLRPPAPGSPVARAGYRAVMAVSVPRLAARRDRPSQALMRALGAAAAGRSSAEESRWAARIEERRGQLVTSGAVVRTTIRDAPEPDGSPPQEASMAVSQGSAWMSLPETWCMFLMRLIRELRPRSCVELGTGFGISGAYLAAALELNEAGHLTTFDRAGGVARIAEEGFSVLGLAQRVNLAMGPIDRTLEQALEGQATIDCALVDAEHTEEATMRHFEALLPFLSAGAVVVFDDLNWEAWGMRRAWRRIRNHRRVSVAIGLRRMGAVVVSGA
jgi:predicted O-methyltransferase YrrM